MAEQTPKRLLSRTLVILSIACVSGLLAWGAAHLPAVRNAIRAADNSIYDAVYKLRPVEMQVDSPVVLLEIDDASLKEIDAVAERRWPWPRELWAVGAAKLREMGAKAVVFDLLLSEKSVYGASDDEAAGKGFDDLTMPVVFAVMGKEGTFVIPNQNSIILGDANVQSGKEYRTYNPVTDRGDSIALAGLKAAGHTPKLSLDHPFRIRYYGPHRTNTGEAVIPAFRVSRLLLPAIDEDFPLQQQIDPKFIKDKIVLIGSSAASLHDLKQTPLSSQYPGVEVQATAMLNLLRGEEVRQMPAVLVTIVSALGALAVSAGLIWLRPSMFKLATIVVAVMVLATISIGLMQRHNMIWLPPAEPLLAVVLASVGALVWVYRIEDARSRFLLHALRQCIAPEVAEELAGDPSKLATGGQRREMSILFTDLQGFTKLTERLRERIEPVLNLYLAEMSQEAFNFQGTIDKYIGDAIMAFWNAPLPQHDHARRACDAALALREHEKRIAPKLKALGADDMFTRIGIHTGPVVVGFFGSHERLTYTAVGDSVNLAARLEPSNKLYGTQILVSEDTVEACGDAMLFRPIDRLRVYGRTEPVGVYELMARRDGATPEQLLLASDSIAAAKAYLDRDWARCLSRVEDILRRHPNDGPANMWRERVSAYVKNPPSEDWDGVYEQVSK